MVHEPKFVRDSEELRCRGERSGRRAGGSGDPPLRERWERAGASRNRTGSSAPGLVGIAIGVHVQRCEHINVKLFAKRQNSSCDRHKCSPTL